jgi:hypothetical protein
MTDPRTVIDGLQSVFDYCLVPKRDVCGTEVRKAALFRSIILLGDGQGREFRYG